MDVGVHVEVFDEQSDEDGETTADDVVAGDELVSDDLSGGVTVRDGVTECTVVGGSVDDV